MIESEKKWIFNLIISANGILEDFSLVEVICKNFPKIKNWEIIMFRPKTKIRDGVFIYEWKKFNLDDFYMKFLFYEDDEKNIVVGIKIFHKFIWNRKKENLIKNVSILILDHLFWEYYFTTKIRWWIEFDRISI